MRTEERLQSSDISNADTKGVNAEDGSASESSLKDPLIILWNDQRFAIPRGSDYASAIAAVKQSDSLGDALANRNFHFEAIIPGRGDQPYKIEENSWAETVQTLAEIVVVITEDIGSGSRLDARRPTPMRPPTVTTSKATSSSGAPKAGKMEIKINFDDDVHRFAVNSSDTVCEVLPSLVNRRARGECSSQYRLFWQGQTVNESDTYDGLGINSGDALDCFKEVRLRKPVIYVQSPKELQGVSVRLSLTKSLTFSAVYPPAPVKADLDFNTIEWTVDASPNGMLRDKRSGLEVSYLYWEAVTIPPMPATPPLSRASSPTQTILTRNEDMFDPACASLSNATAVCLNVEATPLYLDNALKALALNTEARTSFITYWLPSLSKHRRVALEFLPQGLYESAAPMNISPTPDVTTRIFMLFKGVQDEEAGEWVEATERAANDVSFWADIVGVDAGRALDSTLYRVLEWGGMEYSAIKFLTRNL